MDPQQSGKPQESAPPKRRNKKRGAFRNRVEMLLLRFALGTLSRIPERAGLAISAACGSLYSRICIWFGKGGYAVAVYNLKLAFPNKTPEERHAILRSMWRNWGRFIYEAARLMRLTPEQLRARVRLDTPERFDAMLERMKKQGLLVLTAHFGSFEMFHAAIAAHGANVSLVHRPMSNPLVDAFLSAFRGRFGTRVLARGHAAREILRELRAGRIVAIPFDQAAQKENRIFLPFFGVNASTNSGLARLAAGSGAPVYTAVLVREGETMFHRAVMGPEIPIVRTADRDADAIENTRRFNAALEEIIRANPDHWIWNYRRWKQQPAPLCSPYLPWAPPVEAYRAAAAASGAPQTGSPQSGAVAT